MLGRASISTGKLLDVTAIDGGYRLVLEFEEAGGETVSLLVPAKGIAAFTEELSVAFGAYGTSVSPT